MKTPHMFKIRLPKEINLSEGNPIFFYSSETESSLKATYVGRSCIDRTSIFKNENFTGTAKVLADIFDGFTTTIYDSKSYSIGTYPSLVSTLEDMHL